ncbi:Uncharacterised protein [Mycobacteroides abscessus subsp. abscessus]|nr:Uncharacterised protein [Mycobacteroides abscessus subsp. abscessus]
MRVARVIQDHRGYVPLLQLDKQMVVEPLVGI